MSSKMMLQIDGTVAYLWLQDPPRNSLGVALLDEFEQALEQISQAEVHVLVLQGSGKSFCSGVALKEFEALNSEAEALEITQRTQALFMKLQQLPMIVIAAINGVCLGGGVELSLYCDLRYASDKSSFCFPEMGLGIFPAFGGARKLSKLVGIGCATEWIMTGKLFGASEALQGGLLQAVFPKQDFEACLARITKQLSGLDSEAVRVCLQALRDESMPLEQGLSDDAKQVAALLSTKFQF